MREYEAMVIVDARLEEGDIQKAVDRFVECHRRDRGRSRQASIGGARAASPTRSTTQNEGYYFVAKFKAPEDAVETG